MAAAPEAETWRAPRLDPEQAAFAAAMSRRRDPARGAGWEASASPVSELQDPEAYAITLAGHPALLTIPGELAQSVLSSLDPAAAAAQGIARRLLLELALEGVLAALDPVLPVGMPGDSDPAVTLPPGAFPLQTGLELRGMGRRWDAVLQLSHAAAGAVSTAMSRLEPAPSLPEISVPLSVVVGATDLSWRELRSVCAGDVLLPAAGLEGTLLLVAHPRMVWQVRPDPDAGDGAVSVTSLRAPAAELGLEGWMMDDAVPLPLTDAELDELPVRVVFEAGRVEVAVGELSRIGPGHVFALPGRAGLVDIVASGRRIGQGEVVQVGDGAGVRVLRLSGPVQD